MGSGARIGAGAGVGATRGTATGALGCGLRLMRMGSGGWGGLFTGAGIGTLGLKTGAGFAGAPGCVPFLPRGVSL